MESSTNINLTIGEHYQKVLEQIYETAHNAGRNPQEIKLVVVTKTQSVNDIQEVIDAGATDLGENYVEEAFLKIKALKNCQGINWHMIGHVQSRKAQNVCKYFQIVHSVDSVKIAQRLNRFTGDLGKSLPVWMELNVSGEQSKYGWDITRKEKWKEILPDIEKILTFPRLKLLGLMTMPPYSPDPEAARPYYRKLKLFQEFMIHSLRLSNLHGLSIGMSIDFEVAIQEGSTCVRIGQAIFGPRSN